METNTPVITMTVCPRCMEEGILHVYSAIRPGKRDSGYVLHNDDAGRRTCLLRRTDLDKVRG